jgi:hypothetical protein
MEALQKSNDFIVLPSDRNLEPCITERSTKYIQVALHHLSDARQNLSLAFPRSPRQIQLLLHHPQGSQNPLETPPSITSTAAIITNGLGRWG